MARPPGELSTPPLEPVRLLFAAFERHRISAAVGGSALLAAHGLTEQVRGWDVTTEADPEVVEPLLVELGLAYQRARQQVPYASAACFVIDAGDHSIDVIARFALSTPTGVVSVRTRRAGMWQGMPLGDAQQWASAYRLMERTDAAEALERWLNHGQAPPLQAPPSG